jgi:D-lactate dehydrogenase
MDLNLQLQQILPAERIKTRLIDRYAFASDASHFYLVPKAIVMPINTAEIQQLFAFSRKNNINLTFRAGGTSLSGQAVTDGILVDLSRHWRSIKPENEGKTVRVEPAVIGANVNVALKKYGRKMGPDPASITAAMMGGILSNNSSGMCCGVQHNSYHTLKFIKFILPNGNQFSTENKDDYQRFLVEEKGIANGIKSLQKSVLINADLMQLIRAKYKQKNTTGYGLNAFLDYEHPLDILAHLLIGAEGTLGFIAEAVLETLPDLPHKITGMLYFKNPELACNSIEALTKAGAEALEFMDRPALRSVENRADVAPILKTLPDDAAAILCEFQSDTEGSLFEKFEKAKIVIGDLDLLETANFTQNAYEQAVFWKIRKGMYPSVASVRASGTATMLEDLTFPVDRLGEAIVDVQQLFKQFNYADGIIFGHAKDGNLHFCISQDFSTEKEINRFKSFNDALFSLVLNKYKGALKAEHGTGRAVAPYVEAEWGSAGFAIMKALKTLIDPNYLLNPDVIITQDKNLHLSNLKIMPVVEEEVDKCVECGYCERRCPSRDFTMTPRQRIGIRRALKRLESDNQAKIHKEILYDFQFDGMDTCAVDGMCATDCPVDINTGELIKRLRRENHSNSANKTAVFVAKNFKFLEGSARFALKSGFVFNGIFGQNFMKNLTLNIKRIAPEFPLWTAEIGRPPSLLIKNYELKIKNSSNLESAKNVAENVRETLKVSRTSEASESTSESKVIYFSSCISRMMGGDIFETFNSVCQKANVKLLTTNELSGVCCGQIFSSKGFLEAYKLTVNATMEKMWLYTEGGKIPIVMDVTSCTHSFQTSRPYLREENKLRFDALRIMDSIDFAADVLLPRLTILNKKKSIVFHPVCSVSKMGLLPKIQKIGKACAEHAEIPIFSGCCGMAGDRGFYYPKLTEMATKIEANEVNQAVYDGYYSSAKPCEMSLTAAVGKPYSSVLKLLDEVS